jgi:hypothetical protein
MSVKTFEKSFLNSIHQYAFEYAANIIKKSIGSDCEVDSSIINLYQIHNRNEISFNRFKLEFYEPCRLRIAFNKILQASKNKADLLSVDSHLNCWIYKNKVYVIPFGIPYNDYIKPDDVEDFSFLNMQDRINDNITEKMWNYRKNTWNNICLNKLNSWNMSLLTHKIINIKEQINDYEIMQHYINKNTSFAIDPKKLINKLSWIMKP